MRGGRRDGADLASDGTSLQQAVMIAIISSLTIDSEVQALSN